MSKTKAKETVLNAVDDANAKAVDYLLFIHDDDKKMFKAFLFDLLLCFTDANAEGLFSDRTVKDYTNCFRALDNFFDTIKKPD